MGRRYGPLVALHTVVSVCALAWTINSGTQKALPEEESLLRNDAVGHVEAVGLLNALFQSSITTALMANLMINCIILVALFIKAFFFGRLSVMESQKAFERMINYALFKGLFLVWVAPPEIMQITLWLTWLAVLGFLKMFQGLARDRLERLNASPTATMLSHTRVFAVLVLVLLSDLFWIQLCILVLKDASMNTFLLLLFEPFSIAIDTIQAIVVDGMQLFDTWQRHTIDAPSQISGLQPLERSAVGAAWEWRGTIVRNCKFVMDLISLLLALGHCLHIWWLRGLAFQIVDIFLFLNLRALLSAILKRIKGFIRVRTALNTLQGALPDATKEELLTYDDDCAICKEPMARAKRLPCTHLFHLPCLRSWLDQGLAETYSCPTCRRPLFMGGPRIATFISQAGRRIVEDDQGTRDVNGEGNLEPFDGLLLGNFSQQAFQNSLMGPFLSQRWNLSMSTSWRGPDIDAGWVSALHMEAMERDGPAVESRAGHLRRMQIMMMHLASGGHLENQSDDSGWSWWPFSHTSEESYYVPETFTRRLGLDIGSLHAQNGVPERVNSGDSHMDSMINMVREVLPHIPDEVIVQDLHVTNSVTTTVNNLL